MNIISQFTNNNIVGQDYTYYYLKKERNPRMAAPNLGSNPLLNNIYAYFDWDQQGGRLDWFKTYTSTVNNLLQHLAYDYDNLGNIENLNDYMSGNPQTQTFTYDSLNRLTSAQATGGTIGNYAQQSYTYNSSTGNLASKAGVNYGYNDAAQRPVGCHAWQVARLPFAYSCSNSRMALLGLRRRSPNAKCNLTPKDTKKNLGVLVSNTSLAAGFKLPT